LSLWPSNQFEGPFHTRSCYSLCGPILFLLAAFPTTIPKTCTKHLLLDNPVYYCPTYPATMFCRRSICCLLFCFPFFKTLFVLYSGQPTVPTSRFPFFRSPPILSVPFPACSSQSPYRLVGLFHLPSPDCIDGMWSPPHKGGPHQLIFW